MRKEDFFEVIGDLDDGIVEGAKTSMKENANRKAGLPGWIKWGAAAACLCLVIAGVAVWNGGLSGDAPEGGGGPGGGAGTPGGAWPEGVDPVVASVAVIPAGESLLDVADATSVPIGEEDARNVERLGAYLPDALPDGCRYGTASYYETTMKDGTRYHMIRVVYESGQSTAPAAPATEDGQAVPMAGDTAFLWVVYGHRPDTDRPVYQPGEVTAQVLDQMDGGMFYIDYDGVYVGISRMDIGADELMAVIDSIG